jgi:predicted PurR-regulated permease PerM
VITAIDVDRVPRDELGAVGGEECRGHADVFNIIPGGAAIIWLPVAIWLFRSGETGWFIFLVLWSAILVRNLNNVIRPLFISRGSALPLLVVLIGILSGAMAFGFIGIFLGPTILAILYALMREWSPGEYQRQPARQDLPPPA